MESDTQAGIAWKLIAPGAVLLLLGLINAGRIDDPSTFTPTWAVALFIAVGGGLLLLGLVQTFRNRG